MLWIKTTLVRAELLPHLFNFNHEKSKPVLGLKLAGWKVAWYTASSAQLVKIMKSTIKGKNITWAILHNCFMTQMLKCFFLFQGQQKYFITLHRNPEMFQCTSRNHRFIADLLFIPLDKFKQNGTYGCLEHVICQTDIYLLLVILVF